MKSRFGFTALTVAMLVSFVGCASATKARIGQIKTGGQIAITEPGLSIAPADSGIGFKAQIGHIRFGYTTTLDTGASHLVLGIESSTGFDGKDDTLVTSASRIGAINASIDGELAIGLERITLNGVAKIDEGPLLPALYLDHWTGATAKYKSFPEVTGDVSGDMLEFSRYTTFGPWGVTAGFGILNECRAGTIDCVDGRCNAGWGPFLLDGTVTNGECSQGLGFGCYIGITNPPDNGE